MLEWSSIFAAVDATGSGVAVIREDRTIERASAVFDELVAADAPLPGADISALLPGLPELERLGATLGPESLAFVHGSSGRTRRVLAAACFELGGARCLLLADRTRSSRGRAELRDGPVPAAPGDSGPPRASRIRPMSEMGERMAHALALARRYRQEVIVIRLEIEDPAEADLDGIVLGCVRGVDDVGRSRAGRYMLLLPDTDIAGAKVVGRRICSKLQGLGRASLGLARSGEHEAASGLMARAEAACKAASSRGGGLWVSELDPESAEGAVSPA